MNDDLKFVLASSVSDLNPQVVEEIGRNVSSDFKVVYLRGKATAEKEHFEKVYHLYIKLGITNITYCDLENNQDEQVITLINNCDVLHLGGGHTFKFANRIAEGSYTSHILKAINNAKLVVGESAGAILLTDDLEIANVLGENDTNGSGGALKLLNISFLPHYSQSLTEVSNYQTKCNRVLYGAKDGAAIIIDKAGNMRLFDITLM